MLASALQRTTVTAVSVAAGATDTVTGVVDLVAEQVDVEDVEADAATTLTALATIAGVAATATTVVERQQRHHGASRQQLHVRTVGLNKAQCVRQDRKSGGEGEGDGRG